MFCEKIPLQRPDPYTGRPYGWRVVLEDGRRVRWRDLYTGPLTLSSGQMDEACRALLGCGPGDIHRKVARVLRPAIGDRARWPALILHSTTPELKAFEGDLQALERGAEPGDLTTYKETRSVFLAGPGDVTVGRTRTWKQAVSALGVPGVELPDRDHYYLSDALLSLARDFQHRPSESLGALVAQVSRGPRRVRVYSLEPAMQIFLLWLARTSGVDELAVEANDPALSKAWNRKAVLHPTVDQALELEESVAGVPTVHRLQIEASRSVLATALESSVPTVPGYTLERAGIDAAAFVRQLLEAARLLEDRYGLATGCLKASEAGDGARITRNIGLADRQELERLGLEAHRHSDDYVLEAQIRYRASSVAGRQLPLALSAHIRGGRVADGLTLQFLEGTSWKGNLLLDAAGCALLDVPPRHRRRLRSFMKAFLQSFQERDGGLVLAGVDFAVGSVGGALGDRTLLGVEDLNVSFTGAEYLYEFLDKAAGGADRGRSGPVYGLTRVYRPRATGGYAALQDAAAAMCGDGVYATAVASVPGRWGMVGIDGSDPLDALGNLERLQASLLERGLIEQPGPGSGPR